MNVKPFIPLKYWWQGGEVPATVNCTDLQIHAHKAICRIAFNWISRVTLKCYQLSLCTKRCFVYLRVHRHFHSTVHTSTALCTCWGTCWALDPDSCCTCPPFWAEPVAWTSTLCLDTRHGFITLGARAPRVVQSCRPRTQMRHWWPLWRLAGWRLAAAYRSLAALEHSSLLKLAVGGKWWIHFF